MLKKNEKNIKKWILREAAVERNAPAIRQISDALGIGEVLSRLLYCRGYKTPEAARDFLVLGSEMLCDPFLLDGMTDYVWYDNRIYLLFWLVAGLITATRRIGMQKLEEFPREPDACDWRATLARGRKSSR